MYEAFYGLREKPFNLTPDPRYLFLSEKHREAFAHLLFGIKNRSGFVMVTGEIGTGKTTICRNLLNQLDEEVALAFIFNPILNSQELLKKILREFGGTPQGENTLELTDELNAFLLHAAAQGKNCVLIVDEAQNLTPPVLEQIRLLSNLETEREKLIQIILIGQPELGELLSLHELRQLNQRITARYHLKALSEAETAQYIQHRIHIAGGRKSVQFDKPALRLIYKYSGGTPRVINALCDRALLIGYTRELRTITPAVVRQAMLEIKGEKFSVPGEKALRDPKRWLKLIPNPSLLVAALTLFGIAWVLSGPLDRLATEFGVYNRNTTAAAATPPATPSPPQALAENTASAPADAAPASSTAPPAADFNAWLSAASPDAAAKAGVAALFQAWGVRDGEVPATGAEPALRESLQRSGFQVTTLDSSLDQIAVLNLPCLVQLSGERGTLWAALVRASDDVFEVTHAGTTPVSVPRDALAARYSGRALVPWRDPQPDTPTLRIGMNDARVATLTEQLQAVGRLGETTSRYTPDVAAAVRGIQRDTGLHVDGIAGTQVRMVLASWLGGAETPALKPGTRQPVPTTVSGAESNAPAAAPADAQGATLDALVTMIGEPDVEKAAVPSAPAPATAPASKEQPAAPAPAAVVAEAPAPARHAPPAAEAPASARESDSAAPASALESLPTPAVRTAESEPATPPPAPAEAPPAEETAAPAPQSAARAQPPAPRVPTAVEPEPVPLPNFDALGSSLAAPEANAAFSPVSPVQPLGTPRSDSLIEMQELPEPVLGDEPLGPETTAPATTAPALSNMPLVPREFAPAAGAPAP